MLNFILAAWILMVTNRQINVKKYSMYIKKQTNYLFQNPNYNHLDIMARLTVL